MRFILHLAKLLTITTENKKDSQLEEECLARITEMKQEIKDLKGEIEEIRYESSFADPSEI